MSNYFSIRLMGLLVRVPRWVIRLMGSSYNGIMWRLHRRHMGSIPIDSTNSQPI
jgi:hypothetical protein